MTRDARLTETRLWTVTMTKDLSQRISRIADVLENQSFHLYDRGKTPRAVLVRRLVEKGLEFFEKEFGLD
jgi:hypothetical protein